MLSKNIAFDKADSFSIVSVKKSEGLVTIHIKSKQQKSRCPVCRTNSKSIHSHYRRTIKELPAFCNSVQFHLAVRRFYCHNKTCNRKIFAERFKDHFTPYGRVSKRLEEKLLKVALLMGGNPGEKLCRSLNIDRSSSSLIRLIHRQKLFPVQTVITLGIDDWARKKRGTYGTCLVDLDRHKMIELLEDREPVTVENWLKNHPEVRIVSRDRFLNYAKGIAAGAPDAIQVADRWHLLKNLGDDLHKVVERNHQQLKYARKKEIRRLQRASVKQISKETSSVNQIETQKFSRRQWQLEQIKKLQSQGVAIKAIARELNMSRNTVKKYLYLKEPPRRKSTVQVNIALFDTYIRTRIKKEPNIQLMQLYREIKQKGYDGGRTAAYDHLHGYVSRAGHLAPPTLPDIFFVPSKISFLLLRKKDQLTSREQKLVADLCGACCEINTAACFAMQFKAMMENKEGHLLRGWMDQAMTCGVMEIKNFAKGLQRDFMAVKNALTLPWSNGQVEGQINKLKTIKRQMYGRASFDLLRKRLLLDTS